MNEYFEHFRKWQAIYAIIFALAVQFMLYGTRLDAVEIRIDKVERQQDSNELLLVQIQKDIVEVKTQLIYINEALR